MSGRRALATIVFTDVVGYSAHMGQHEERALVAVRRDLALMRQLCEHHEGWAVKEIGDALMMHFGSAVKAVECAQAIQLAIATQARQLPAGSLILQHRIGMHLGDVLVDDHDVRGDGVNIAARVQSAAKPGTVYFSQTVRDAIPAQYYESAVKVGSRGLKNIEAPVMLYAFPALKTAHPARRTYQWLGLGCGVATLLAIATHTRFQSPTQPITRQAITSLGTVNRPETPARSIATDATNRADETADELAVSVPSTTAPETPPSSETALAATNDYAAFSLAPGFQQASGTGNIGGPRLASEAMGIALTSTGKCNGYIDTLPDHRLTLTNDFDYLSIATLAEGYTSLVIVGPNAEVWCATDQNPGISGFYEQGSYEIYVGNLSQGAGPRYELIITE